jgi:hypothetical protein
MKFLVSESITGPSYLLAGTGELFSKVFKGHEWRNPFTIIEAWFNLAQAAKSRAGKCRAIKGKCLMCWKLFPRVKMLRAA